MNLVGAGVGNIADVSVALATGGPGAIFWMWAVALMGWIVKFTEISLGMAYRRKDPKTGVWHGGFYWTVHAGLGKNWAWVGSIWAVVLDCAMVFAPAVQDNSIVGAVNSYFNVNPLIIGVIIALLLALVLMGGLKSISRFAEMVVPFMALACTIVAIVILIMNVGAIPGVFAMIFQYAFTPTAATGGFAASAIIPAIKGLPPATQTASLFMISSVECMPIYAGSMQMG